MRYLKPIIYSFAAIVAFAISAPAPAFAANINFTLEAWVNPTTSIASKAIIVKNNELRLVTDASGNLVCQIHNGSAWQTTATSSSALSLSSWQFVACSYNGSFLRVFINGEEKGVQAMTANVQNTANSILFGKDAGGTYGLFSGKIDHVKIYKVARTADQIRMDYETGPPPVAHWKMDEKVSGNGATIYDTSGSNNGTLSDANGSGLNCGAPGKYVADNASLQITSAITMQAWVNIAGNNDTNSWQTIIHKATVGWSDGYWFNVTNGREPSVSLEGVGAAEILSTDDTLTDNIWSHVAVTFDSQTEEVIFYINGSLSKRYTGKSGTIASTSGESLNIGLLRGSVSYMFNGLIDDVRIYNYARTQKQIIFDMLGSKPAYPDGYVGYWKFDEGKGTTAYDASMHSNNGTINGADWTMNGKIGGALDFVSDYVDCGNDESLDITDAITISAWVKGSGTIVNKGGEPETYSVCIRSNKPVFYRELQNGANKYLTGAISLDTNVWHHIVAVDDDTNMKIYVDGVKDANELSSSAWSAGVDSSHLLIGHVGAPGSEARLGDGYFDGLIDEVKIYPFALTPAEIKQEYNRGKAIVLGTPRTTSSTWDDGGFGGDPPVAWWKMDEKSGTTAYDTSANSNNGTINGATWKGAGECHQGACLGFDGEDDYVDPSANINTCYKTIEVWFKANSVSGSQGIVGKQYEPPITHYGWGLSIQSNALRGMASSNNTEWYSNLSYALSPNTWYHAALTFTGFSGTQTGKLYVNGVEVASHSGTAACVGQYELLIGAGQNDTPNGFFNGFIDDVRIYDYARTPAQIAWDYNRGKPVAHWKMD